MASALACGVRRSIGTAFLVLAALIGFSRMYLFVHYPTDVIAGAALGIFFGVAAWRIAGHILRNFPPTLICRCKK